MTFNRDIWKQKLAQSFSGLRTKASEWGVDSLFSLAVAATLWPALNALKLGDPTSIVAVVGAVGTEIIATNLIKLKDVPEKEQPAYIQELLDSDQELHTQIQKLLVELDALSYVSEEDKPWLEEELRKEIVNQERMITIGRDVLQSVVNTGDGNVINVTYNLLTSREYEEEKRNLSLRDQYLSEVADDCNLLPWANMSREQAGAEGGEDLFLSDVYIDLDLTEMHRMEEEAEYRQFVSEVAKEKRITAQEMVNQEDKLLILGDPGSGKSTLVKYLAYLLAQASMAEAPEKWLNQLGDWDHQAIFPIFIELRNFSAQLDEGTKGGRKDVLNYIKTILEEYHLAEYFTELSQQIRQGKTPLMIIMDGLDEVPSDQRENVIDAVNDFCRRYSQHRYIVTCRPYAYIGQGWELKQFKEVTLAPFSEEQIARFVKNWYARLSARGRLKPAEEDSKSSDLTRAVERRDLRSLAERPLLLTIMAQLHAFRGKLPEDRTELYAEAVNLLLDRWQQRLGENLALIQQLDIPNLKMSDLEAGLYDVAFHAHKDSLDGHTADISEGALRSCLAPYLGDSYDKAGVFLNYIRERAGLLIRHKHDAYTFPHRSFQEFLAACYLVSLPDYPLDAAGLINESYDQWREVFVLAAGHAARTHRLSLAISSISELLPRSIEEVAEEYQGSAIPMEWWQRAQLAGEALVEIGLLGVKRSETGKALHQRVQSWLAGGLERETLELHQRAAGGRVLARIGDPRAEVMTLERMPLAYVPGGPFMMGEGDDLHEVDVPGFYISQYPITNQQYRFFVEDGGYHQEEWWAEAIREELWKSEGYFDPRTDTIRTAPYEYGVPLNLSNHPVVGVSWYEVKAFTRWLSSYWREQNWLPQGWSVQLPSEAEWEKAARGGVMIPKKDQYSTVMDGLEMPELPLIDNPDPEREYPWLGEFQPGLANTGESNLDTTSPVGCFSAGKSPYGVEDLSGNVWEWTRSIEKEYPYDKDDGREKAGDITRSNRLALRGGSFGGGRYLARCAFRLYFPPYYGDDTFGFRVVVVASPHSS